jgi:endoglucanase
MLLQVTSLPTAAGREAHVVEWIKAWARSRPWAELTSDASGNLTLARAGASAAADQAPPLYITAHLDHPAFVVERVVGPGTLECSFRGGVMDPYFEQARVEVWAATPGRGQPGVLATGRLLEKRKAEPFPLCLVELESGPDDDGVRSADAPDRAGEICPGDIARWALPEASVTDDVVRTHACDDLAAVAAALATFERLRDQPRAAHVRLLFTRAEEIGFVGAIAACKLGTIQRGSRVIALENSRSFAESPIGAGPIVRVGDRVSTFSPALTGAVAKVAEALAQRRGGAGAAPAGAGFRWQRKLMPGGACEASAYQAYGYESTCVCLPLGNYHNMADLDRVQAGEPEAVRSARVGPEYISASDYLGMIDLLEACATELAEAEALRDRLEKMFADKKFVLESEFGGG